VSAPRFESPPSMLPPARHPEARPARPIVEPARQAAPQRLDPFGRAAPVRNPVEEKVLDIPVFLSRKAN
jgi:cell division protein FtsZ